MFPISDYYMTSMVDFEQERIRRARKHPRVPRPARVPRRRGLHLPSPRRRRTAVA